MKVMKTDEEGNVEVTDTTTGEVKELATGKTVTAEDRTKEKWGGYGSWREQQDAKKMQEEEKRKQEERAELIRSGIIDGVLEYLSDDSKAQGRAEIVDALVEVNGDIRESQRMKTREYICRKMEEDLAGTLKRLRGAQDNITRSFYAGEVSALSGYIERIRAWK